MISRGMHVAAKTATGSHFKTGGKSAVPFFRSVIVPAPKRAAMLGSTTGSRLHPTTDDALILPEAGFRRRSDAWLARFAAWLERRSGSVAAALLLVALLAALGIASRSPIWYDEIVSLFIARLPAWHDIWSLYALGRDTTGPIPSFVARLGLYLPFPPELSLRIPFMLAFLCMCAGIYIFVRRRYPAGYALAALMLPMTLPILWFDMTLARAYALMLGAAGLALCCWQSAADDRARPWSVVGLWLALATAIAAHFFAIFLFVPFAAGQWVRDWARRRADGPVWLAILLFPAGYLVVLPGAERARSYYADGFGAASIRYVYTPYRELYGSFGWVAASILMIVALGLIWWGRAGADSSPRDSERFQGFSKAEWVLSATLMLLPVYATPASKLLGVYSDRYVVTFYIGFILFVVACVAEALSRQTRAGSIAFMTILLCASVARTHEALDGVGALLHPHQVHADATAQVLSRPWVRSLPANSLPLVMDPFNYLQYIYYGGPAFRSRAYSLVEDSNLQDPALRRKDLFQINMELLPPALPVHATAISDFLVHHRHFLVLTRFDESEWLPDYLLRRQASKGDLAITLLFRDPAATLLDVQMKTP